MDKTKECFDRLTVVLREHDPMTAMEAALMLVGHSVSSIAVGFGWLSESESEQNAIDVTAKVSQLVEDHAAELKRRKEAAKPS
jgi:hypothetical protein